MKNNWFSLILLLLTVPYPGSSQGNQPDALSCEVYRSYPPLSLTKEELREVHTLTDLNKYYQASWIRTYISVAVLAYCEGKMERAVSENDLLSQRQKDLMNRADLGTNITVKVQYLPENTLVRNDSREISFSFTIEPENEAQYPGGPQQLKQYLLDNVMDKIPAARFRQYQLAAIKFTIDAEGRISNPHVFWSSEDERTDQLLLEAICNMPTWKPAAYANGKKVEQEFVLTVGDMESCVVNLLNIRQEGS